MIYRISDFKYKDVINIKDGNCLGLFAMWKSRVKKRRSSP